MVGALIGPVVAARGALWVIIIFVLYEQLYEFFFPFFAREVERIPLALHATREKDTTSSSQATIFNYYLAMERPRGKKEKKNSSEAAATLGGH